MTQRALRQRYGRANLVILPGSLAERVDLAARDNARETEGFYAAGGFDTPAGLVILRRVVRDVLETAQSGREFDTYSLGLTKPLTKAQAASLWKAITKSYGWAP